MSKLQLDTAINFRLAAKRCLEERDLGNHQYEMLAFPAIVNLSFSFELYLKYILNKRSLGYNRRSHDLLYLYNSLDDESKKLIEQSFIIKSHFRTIQPYDKALSLFQNWFQEKLRKCSNGFIEWRYPYEFIERNGEIESDYGFLLKVTDMLEDYGLRLERGEL